MKKIAIIGLGKIGYNIALNLLSKDYSVIAYNRSPDKTKELEKKGAIPAFSFKEITEKTNSPRIILLAITAGKPVEKTINQLIPYLKKEDILIDSGNSFYKDSIKHHDLLKKKGIYFIDMGISGGIQGARNGASLMIGCDESAFKKIEFLCKDLALKDGYSYLGNSGAGHFAKMIHNGIEYAMLEGYAEGFEALKKSQYKFNLEKISKIWNNGSIIQSRILKIIEKVFAKNAELKNIYGIIGGGETGTWAYKTAKSQGTDFKTLKYALDKRKSSEKKQTFSTKLISALRHEFGGHEIKKKIKNNIQ